MVNNAVTKLQQTGLPCPYRWVLWVPASFGPGTDHEHLALCTRKEVSSLPPDWRPQVNARIVFWREPPASTSVDRHYDWV